MDREPLLLEAFGPCLPSSSERGKHFKKMILDLGSGGREGDGNVMIMR